MAIENINTIDERRSKIDKTGFSIAICRPTGDKWQSETLFLSICDERSSIVKGVCDRHIFGVITHQHKKLDLSTFSVDFVKALFARYGSHSYQQCWI